MVSQEIEPGELTTALPRDIILYNYPMDVKQEKLLMIARSLIGAPYKYGAEEKEIPQFLDCSSFTQYIYKRIGMEIPRSTILQATIGKTISFKSNSPKLKTNLKIGDLLFFRGTKGHYNDELFPGKKIYIGHVALWSGEGQIIHGSSKKGAVAEEKLEDLIEKIGLPVMIKRILD